MNHSLSALLVLLFIAPTASSQHLVTSSADSGSGTLREAIALAMPGDTIKFAFPMTIALSTSLVLSTDAVTITGSYPDITLEPGSPTSSLVLDGPIGCKVTGLRFVGLNRGLILINGAAQNQIGDVAPQDRVELTAGMGGALVVGTGTNANHFRNVEMHGHSSTALLVVSGASANVFGDGTLAGAVNIHSNAGIGVQIDGSGANTDANVFDLCLIGTDASGLLLASNGGDGVFISGSSRNNRLIRCVISGNLGAGVLIDGGAQENSVEECHIGVDLLGTGAMGNARGVHIRGGIKNRIGPHNVISGQPGHGVIFEGNATHSNELFSSIIGPNGAGAFLGNGESGVYFRDGAFENVVEGNLVSSNRWGVLMEGLGPHDNEITDNLIGTDASGSAALGNLFDGILLRGGAVRNVLRGNVIGGNGEFGIKLEGSSENLVTSNAIGVDPSITNAIPNLLGGVLVQGSRNQIGGSVPNEGNVICANGGWGIQVNTAGGGMLASENAFENNTVGLPGLGNASGGVFFGSGAVDNVLGGLSTSAAFLGNIIHSNSGVGVLVDDSAGFAPADGNKILTNSITENAGAGIELAGSGNCLIPAPIIAAANSAGVSGYTTTSGVPCLVQVFRDSDDEGREFLGEAWVMSSYGAFSVAVALSPGDRVTATQTTEHGCTTLQAETSPFSKVMTAVEVGSLGCFCPSSDAPCGNGDPNAGCANSTGVGATLRAHGSTSVADDDLTFSAEQLPRGTFSMLLGSLAQRNIPFGDGRLCIGGGGVRMWRFQVRNSRQWGAVVYGAGLVARSHMFFAGGHINSGDTWYFQAFYRDTFGPCGSGRNLSNNVKITFTP